MPKETTIIGLIDDICDIYALEKPETIKEAIVYKKVFAVPSHSIAGSTIKVQERFQFDCFAENLVTAQANANTLISRLDNLQDYGDIRNAMMVNRFDYKDPQSPLFISSVDFLII